MLARDPDQRRVLRRAARIVGHTIAARVERAAGGELGGVGHVAGDSDQPALLAAQHRQGSWVPGEVAVVVVAAAPHRKAAFAACRWIIDEIKERLPVWKREHYADGASEWVGCGCHRNGEQS